MEYVVQERAAFWCTDAFDTHTRNEVNKLIESDPDLLKECFYKELEFGTGGLRGLMGVGTNRMNIYTVGYATQGLANYILKSFPEEQTPSIAIAYDSRNNSPLFARRAAEIMAANGIKAYLFEELRPTPLLSFALRHLNCQSGIVITASHNPKEYNGYKVYWNDGGQLVPPHDSGVISEVRKISTPDGINTTFDERFLQLIGKDIDEAYLKACQNLYELPMDHLGKKELKICFTSLHGTGITMVPKALESAGFQKVISVEEQAIPDGDFPTVKSPNPEERSAMSIGLRVAEEAKADILFGTDPDTDRVGMAVRNEAGQLILLNGNEAAALLIKFLCEIKKEKGTLISNGFIAKTIVTSELLKAIADYYAVTCHETLTGFKYIAELIKNLEGKETFIGGGEESYGYLIGDVVRDKDAVISTVMLSEMAAWAKSNGKTVYSLLKEIRLEHGFYKEALVSLVKKGISGAEEIQQIMRDTRDAAPKEIGGSMVVKVADFKSGIVNDIMSGTTSETGLPSSNVLQFFLADGSKITARPSGTEPKIKYYISVKRDLTKLDDYNMVEKDLDKRISGLKAALGIQA